MNAIRCPKCGAINTTSAMECDKCRFSFTELPPASYVSVPASDYEKTIEVKSPQLFGSYYEITPDNETGAKVHFWYRIYCSLFVILAIVFICTGFYTFVAPRGTFSTSDRNSLLIGGLFYILMGIATGAVYTVALLSPRKPWSWIMGVVLLAIGIVTCCFLPSLILLIYWAKEETRVYFGRT